MYSKKAFKKVICVVMIVCTLMTICCITTGAITLRSSDYINQYSASLSAKAGGKIGVFVDVTALQEFPSIGASKIVIYEAIDGKNFTPIKTYIARDYPAMLSSGIWYQKTAITHSGTPGYKYYAVVTCYAGNASGGDSKVYTTTVVTAKK